MNRTSPHYFRRSVLSLLISALIYAPPVMAAFTTNVIGVVNDETVDGSGVAHTYMAAERLEKLCLLEKWGVSIETQGALGTENRAVGYKVFPINTLAAKREEDLSGNGVAA